MRRKAERKKLQKPPRGRAKTTRKPPCKIIKRASESLVPRAEETTQVVVVKQASDVLRPIIADMPYEIKKKFLEAALARKRNAGRKVKRVALFDEVERRRAELEARDGPRPHPNDVLFEMMREVLTSKRKPRLNIVDAERALRRPGPEQDQLRNLQHLYNVERRKRAG